MPAAAGYSAQRQRYERAHACSARAMRVPRYARYAERGAAPYYAARDHLRRVASARDSQR